MHGAGAALGDAAAVFGAGKPDRVAQHPKQGRVGFDIDVVIFAVDGKGRHTRPPAMHSLAGSGRSSHRMNWPLCLVSSLSCSNSNANPKFRGHWPTRTSE